MSSSYLSRRDLESLRPDLQKIVNRVVGKSDATVLEEIEYCLYNGYDRRKTADKLSQLVDGKRATRMSEKLEDLLDDFKVTLKSRKRAGEDTERVEPKKIKQNRFDVPPTVIPAAEPPKAPPPAVLTTMSSSTSSGLTSDQIKSMMDNAQRQIEARKTALNQFKQEQQTAAVRQATEEQQTGTATPNPAAMTEAEREARLAQIRARISGTLANILPQATGGVGSAAPTVAVPDKPKPLILDAEGRTVDKSGREINLPTLEPTLKANIRALKRDGPGKGVGSGGPMSGTITERGSVNEEAQPSFFDERIGVKVPLRNRRSLRFHEPGKFMQMAEKMRMKAQLEKLQNEISQIARKTGISSATKLALIAPKTDSKTDEVPQMEWWDSVILTNDLLTMEGDRIAIREAAITNLIEHPTQMRPPSELTKIIFILLFFDYIFPWLTGIAQ